ncbi:MAG: MFS transporter [Chloroflexi bacterium]|nr:MFS transporter [Chloroflexota bacterium]
MLQARELAHPVRLVRGMFYGWWLAVIGAVIMVIGTVPLFQALSLWMPILQQNFGWTTTQLSWAFTLTRVEGTVMGPIAGWGVDKLGPRKMVVIGLLIFAAGFILFSRTANLWMFYLSFVIVSLGAGLGSWLPANTALNNWFRARRSTAMSIPMLGFGLGGVVIVPLMAWAMGWDARTATEIPGRLGWQNTALVVGCVGLVASVPLAMLVRNRPEDYGQHPDGIDPDTVTQTGPQQSTNGGTTAPDYSWQEAIRTRAFWLITMGHASSSIIIISVMTYLGLVMVEKGLTLVEVGLVISVQTAVSTAFMVIGGMVGDRIPIRIAIWGFSFLQSIAIVVLLFAETLPLFFLFGILMGIGFGGRTPLTTSIRGVYFGRSSFARITGISMIPMNIMFIVVVPYIAWMRDSITGTYTLPFATIAIVSAIGSFMFLVLGNPQLSPSQRRQADVRRLVTRGAGADD